ncbi:hypothetical protein GGI42DRAFT_84121 [Trichoderma sp. SZMC 28013]
MALPCYWCEDDGTLDVCHFYSLTQRSTTIRLVAHFPSGYSSPTFGTSCVKTGGWRPSWLDKEGELRENARFNQETGKDEYEYWAQTVRRLCASRPTNLVSSIINCSHQPELSTWNNTWNTWNTPSAASCPDPRLPETGRIFFSAANATRSDWQIRRCCEPWACQWMRRRGHAQSDVGGILDRNAGTGDCLQRMATGIKVERSIVTPVEKKRRFPIA